MKRSLRLALIGKDVSKSDSGKIHEFILTELGVACEYECISLAPHELDDSMYRLLGDFDGFNVTIPFKRDVMEYLDEIVGDGVAFGAVNTVVCAQRTGYNTDGWGFLQMLRAENVCAQGKRVLILGAGGAGRSTAIALKNVGAEVFLYRRNRKALEETCKELGVNLAQEIENGDYDIIINATGVGMHDTVGVSPVGRNAFQGVETAIDLIYKPQESEFLRLARESGAKTVNGRAMLFYQAYYSDCLYLSREVNASEAEALYKKYTKAFCKK